MSLEDVSMPDPNDSPDSGTEAMASVFADPGDLERYRAAKEQGATEEQALLVGDNGQGAWGDDTTSTNIPIVALPADTPGLKRGRLVEVWGPQGKVIAKVGDKMPNYGDLKGKATIDLNPAAAKIVGHGGGLAPVTWKWADGGAQDTVASQYGQQIDSAMAKGGLRNAQFLDSEAEGVAAPDELSTADATTGDDNGLAESISTPQSVQDVIDAIGADQQGNTSAPPVPQATGKEKVVGVDKQGGKILDNGVTVYPDNSVKYQIEGSTFYQKSGQKPVRLPKGPEDKIYTFTDDIGIRVPYKVKDGKMERVPFTGEDLEHPLVPPEGATGTDAIKDLPPDVQARIKAFATYKDSPPTGRAVNSNPFFYKYLNFIRAVNPDYSVRNFKTGQQLMNEFASTRPGVAGGNILSINTAIDHMGKLDGLVDKLWLTSRSTDWNKFTQWMQQHTGNPDVLAYNTAMDEINKELGRAFMGSAPYAESLKQGQQHLAAANSPQALHNVIRNVLTPLLGDRLGEIGYRWDSVFHEPYDHLVSPKAKSVLSKWGVSNFGGDNISTKPAALQEYPVGTRARKGSKWQVMTKEGWKDEQ